MQRFPKLYSQSSHNPAYYIGVAPGGSGGAMDPPLFSWSFPLTRYNAHACITRVSRKAVVRVSRTAPPNFVFASDAYVLWLIPPGWLTNITNISVRRNYNYTQITIFEPAAKFPQCKVHTNAANSSILRMSTVVLVIARVGAVCHIQLQSCAIHIIQYN